MQHGALRARESSLLVKRRSGRVRSRESGTGQSIKTKEPDLYAPIMRLYLAPDKGKSGRTRTYTTIIHVYYTIRGAYGVTHTDAGLYL